MLKRNSQFQHQTHGYFAVALVPRGTWSSRPTFCCWIICKLFLGVGRKGPQAICSKQWICRICCVIFMSQDAWCTSYNPRSTWVRAGLVDSPRLYTRVGICGLGEIHNNPSGSASSFDSSLHNIIFWVLQMDGTTARDSLVLRSWLRNR